MVCCIALTSVHVENHIADAFNPVLLVQHKTCSMIDFFYSQKVLMNVSQMGVILDQTESHNMDAKTSPSLLNRETAGGIRVLVTFLDVICRES